MHGVRIADLQRLDPGLELLLRQFAAKQGRAMLPEGGARLRAGGVIAFSAVFGRGYGHQDRSREVGNDI